MPRIHKNYREGKSAIYTNESKFTENINTIRQATEALQEGNTLRNKLQGKRILIDINSRELKNSFRL